MFEKVLFILIMLFVIFLVWAVPAALIAYALRKKLKRKVSKGWCFFIALIAFFVSMFIEVVLLGVNKPGYIDTAIRFAGLSVVFTILYDKSIISVFDTEKEIKEKYKKQSLIKANQELEK